MLLAIAVFEGSSGMLTDGDRDMNNNTNSDKTYEILFSPLRKTYDFYHFQFMQKDRKRFNIFP